MKEINIIMFILAGADGNRRQSRTLAFLSIDSMKTEIVNVIAKMKTILKIMKLVATRRQTFFNLQFVPASL